MLPESTGVLVEYGAGDSCHINNKIKYSSEIEFVCHLDGLDNNRLGHDLDEVERPVFVSVDRGGCHYRFRWLTQQACPICKRSQTQETVSRCEKMTPKEIEGLGGIALDEHGKVVKFNENAVLGMKKIVQKARVGERCFMPQNDQSVDISADTLEMSSYKSGDPNVVQVEHYMNSRGKFQDDDWAQGLIQFEHCNLL